MGNTSSTGAASLRTSTSSTKKEDGEPGCINPQRLSLGPNEVQGLVRPKLGPQPLKPFGEGPGGDPNPYAPGKQQSREVWRQYFNGEDADL